MTSPQYDWRSVLIIRHGATALNSDDHTRDRIRGWTDYPLSAQGAREAAKLAGQIAVTPPDVLLYSDLTRSEQTASIIADTLGLVLAGAGASFRPWDVGLFVGANAAGTMPKLARYAVESHKVVPGGESFDTFRHRFLGGLLTVLKRHGGLVGIVTHHRCERLLKAWAKAQYPENGDVDLEEFTKKGEPTGHCEIIKIPMARLESWKQWFDMHCRPNRNFHDSDLAMITLEEKKNAIHRVHPDLQPGAHADPAVRKPAGTDI